MIILQANNGGSEETSTEEEAPKPRRARRLAARTSASKPTVKRGGRQRRQPFSRETAASGASERAGLSEGGSFLAMIANAAVSVDGLRRVSFQKVAFYCFCYTSLWE